MSEKPPDDLTAQVGILIVLLLVLCPTSGIIVARALRVPGWYGAVAGGWVLAGLTLWQIRKTVHRLARQRAVHTAEPEPEPWVSRPPTDWVREPPEARRATYENREPLS